MHRKLVYYFLFVKHIWYYRNWDQIYSDSNMECLRSCPAHHWVSYGRVLCIITALLRSSDLCIRELLCICTETPTAHSNTAANVSRYEWCAVRQFLGGRRANREQGPHPRWERDDQHPHQPVESNGS